jgi:hypothetical protein
MLKQTRHLIGTVLVPIAGHAVDIRAFRYRIEPFSGLPDIGLGVVSMISHLGYWTYLFSLILELQDVRLKAIVT